MQSWSMASVTQWGPWSTTWPQRSRTTMTCKPRRRSDGRRSMHTTWRNLQEDYFILILSSTLSMIILACILPCTLCIITPALLSSVNLWSVVVHQSCRTHWLARGAWWGLDTGYHMQTRLLNNYSVGGSVLHPMAAACQKPHIMLLSRTKHSLDHATSIARDQDMVACMQCNTVQHPRMWM